MTGRVLASICALTLMGAVGAPAAADEPASTCTAGPASEASAQRPHATDAAGDATAVSQAPQVGSSHYDLRAMWIGTGPLGYTVNIVVEGWDSPQHGMLLFDYGDNRWASANISWTGAVTFEYGTTEKLDVLPAGYPRRYPREALTTGRVDGATITIDLPASTLPSPGSTLEWEQVRAYQQAFVPVLGGFTLATASVLADDFANGTRCEVALD